MRGRSVRCACCGRYHWETADMRRCIQQLSAGRQPKAARDAAKTDLGPVLRPRPGLLLTAKDLERAGAIGLRPVVEQSLTRMGGDDDRDAYVLARRLNLRGDFATLREIGEELDLTGEAVRLSETAGMQRLREAMAATAAGRRAVQALERVARHPERGWETRATTLIVVALPKTPLPVARHLASALLGDVPTPE